jgi:hypothetical protein
MVGAVGIPRSCSFCVRDSYDSAWAAPPCLANSCYYGFLNPNRSLKIKVRYSSAVVDGFSRMFPRVTCSRVQFPCTVRAVTAVQYSKSM